MRETHRRESQRREGAEPSCCHRLCRQRSGVMRQGMWTLYGNWKDKGCGFFSGVPGWEAPSADNLASVMGDLVFDCVCRDCGHLSTLCCSEPALVGNLLQCEQKTDTLSHAPGAEDRPCFFCPRAILLPVPENDLIACFSYIINTVCL